MAASAYTRAADTRFAQCLIWRSSAVSRILGDKMRRMMALAVALLIGLPLIAPLLPFNAATSVPLCCRRNGQHHCMGAMLPSAATDQGPAMVAPKCPRFPMASVLPQSLALVTLDANSASVDLFVRPAALPQTEARYRIAFARSRQKRGPPVIVS
jgi:hypothetical protein